MYSGHMDFETKHGHELTIYWTDFDNVGVVGKLAILAVERHQNHLHPKSLLLGPGQSSLWKELFPNSTCNDVHAMNSTHSIGWQSANVELPFTKDSLHKLFSHIDSHANQWSS